jgi:hypothetical protein
MSHANVQLVAAHFAEVVEGNAVRVELGLLASGEGVSLRSVQRAVDLLRNAGVIAGARGRYRILDAVRLQNLASSNETIGHDTTRPKAKALRPKRVRLEDVCECLAQLVAEVASLRAEVAALRAGGAMTEPAPHLPVLDAPALDAPALDDAPAAPPLPPADAPTSPLPSTVTKGRGSRGAAVADDVAALQRLVSLATDKRGKQGSMSGAALLLDVTEGGVRHALKVGRVTPELAARVRAALADLNAVEG